MGDQGSSDSWRDRLYRTYVSSGQSGLSSADVESVRAILRAREGYIRPAIAKHIPADKSTKILDLGCGHGPWIHFLKEAGYTQLVGVETSLEQVAAAKAIGLNEVVHGNALEYLNAAADGSFGVI